MSDSQWPRYEVFLQERPDRPHRNVGSVHAPDPEMALLNARDVFVRRPTCHSLWVVPAESILSCTQQQIEAGEIELPPATEGPLETYHVFQKSSQRRSMEYVQHVGQVQAANAEQALAQAVSEFAGQQPVYVWWVLPERAIVRSDEEDIPSFFLPAEDKPYKQPQQFRTVTMMKEIKAASQEEEPA